MDPSLADADEFEPTRRLCVDGSCLGVLDAEGRCKVCGLDAEGAPAPEAFGVGLHGTTSGQPMGLVPADEARGDEPASAFDAGRRLCTDGGCIGVVGADGRCGECGRPAP